MNKGQLYLLPMTLGDGEIGTVIPQPTLEAIIDFKYLIVENIKTTRRYLKKISRDVNIDEITFFELNKHTDRSVIGTFLKPCSEGFDVGIISEAGCPAIADPGSDVVAIAHARGIKVVPLVGPSSILLALMGSGFNGQKFAFNGYLNRDSNQRQKEIKQLETLGHKGFSQIFMETPFRNQALLEDLIKVCSPTTRLCIAANITLENELVITKTIKDWQKKLPNLHKQPTVFVLGS